MALLVGPLSHTPKGWWSDSPSGYVPRLWGSIPGWGTNGRQSFDVSLSTSMFLPLSLINTFIFMWRFTLKKKERERISSFSYYRNPSVKWSIYSDSKGHCKVNWPDYNINSLYLPNIRPHIIKLMEYYSLCALKMSIPSSCIVTTLKIPLQQISQMGLRKA